MCVDAEWLDARILATQAEIAAMELLVVELSLNGGIVTYTLDTGQSRQVVTRMDSVRAGRYLDSLYNRYATLCQRRNAGSTFTARPGW